MTAGPISDGLGLLHEIPASRVNSPGVRRVSNLELRSDCLLQQSSVSDFGPPGSAVQLSVQVVQVV